MKRFVVQITVLMVLAGALVAQQPSPPPEEPGLVVRVTTRMVQVDTVVLDKEGHPVKGLKADDFTVTEDGVRQRIASFSERISQPPNPAPPPVLPPHVTTNRPVVTQTNAENGTVAVLLLDGLNTPPQDRIYVKRQMLKFLARQYDPNTKLAVIALGNKLTVLRGGGGQRTTGAAVGLQEVAEMPLFSGSLAVATLELQEREPTAEPNAKEARLEQIREARMKGYEGDSCGECGNFTLVRNGTCLKCETCGATSGCS